MNYEFEATAKMPLFWWHKADCLMEAARVLYIEHQHAIECVKKEFAESGTFEETPERRQLLNRLHLPRVNMLLVGLAFENIAKGILVAKNPELVNSKELSSELKGPHTKLPEWLKKAGIDLSDPKEADLVKRLGEAVQWAAKYPTPIYAKDMKLSPVVGMGGVTEPGNYFHSDPPIIQHIWERLCKLASSIR